MDDLKATALQGIEDHEDIFDPPDVTSSLFGPQISSASSASSALPPSLQLPPESSAISSDWAAMQKQFEVCTRFVDNIT